MLQYLGRLLSAARDKPPPVAYLSKAENEPVWRIGKLLGVDPQGATFETEIDGIRSVESLPWGSIGAVRVRLGEITDTGAS